MAAVVVAPCLSAWAAEEEEPLFGDMMLTPTRINGSVGFSYNQRMAEHKKPDQQYFSLINMTIGKGAIGYIIDPAILQWNTDINLGITLTQHIDISRLNDTPQDSTSTVRILNNNSNILVFPRSTFPLKLYLQQSLGDTTEGEDWSRAMAHRRMGLLQGYQNRDWGFGGDLGYEQTIAVNGPEKYTWGLTDALMPWLQVLENSFRTNTLTFNTHNELDGQRIDFSGREVWQSNNAYAMQNRYRESTLLMRHEFTGLSNWSLGSTGNVVKQRELILKRPDRVSGLSTSTSSGTTMQQQYTRRDSLWHQWVSNGYWRSEEEPFQLFGSVRYFRTRDNLLNKSRTTTTNGWVYSADLAKRNAEAADDSITDTTFRTETMSTAAGGSYLINPQLQLNSNMTADRAYRQQEGSHDASHRSSQNMDIAYTSENIELFGMQYHWLTSMTGGSQQSDGMKPSFRGGQRVGHGAYRIYPIAEDISLMGMINENLAITESTGQTPLRNLMHTATARISQEGEGTRTNLDLTCTDNRFFGEIEEDSQLMTTQLSRTYETSSGVTWGGNFTIQWNRRNSATSTMGAEKTVFTYANFNYSNPNLFNVRRLRLTSMLMMGSNDWHFGIYDPSKLQRTWWNRLDYQIGKLTAGITTNINEVSTQDGKGQMDGMILFEVRRSIGMIF